MTRDEFGAQYQLLKKVTDRDATTYHALASTGAVVMVHLFEGVSAAEGQGILDLIPRLEPAERRRVLTTSDVEGVPLVVTRFITDFDSLGLWLTAHVGHEETEPPTLGEFSGMFETPRASGLPPVAAPPPEASVPVAPAVAPPPPPAPAAPVLGEFTSMFRREDLDAPEAAANVATPDPLPAAPAPETAGASPSSSGGEFTGLFKRVEEPSPPLPPATQPLPQATQPPPPVPPTVQSPAADDTGEFTGLFRAAVPTPPPPPLPAEPFPMAPPAAPDALAHFREAPKESTPPAEAGRFTRMFRAAEIPAPTPTPAPPPQAPSVGPPAVGGAGLFEKRGDAYLDRLQPPEPAAALPPPPPLAAPAPAAGPSEYTRVIAQRPQVDTRAPGLPGDWQPPPAVRPKGRSRGLLIGGAIGIIVLAIALVVFAAMRAGSTSEGAPSAPETDSVAGS